MSINPVQAWLERTLRAAMAWKVAAVVACLLGGLFVLYVSFWASYAVIWIISSGLFPLKHRAILLIAAGFMTLVVVAGVRQNWEDLDPLRREVQLAKEMDITLTPYSRYGISYTTDAVKAGVFEIRSLASFINWILCGGVKLVLGSVGRLRQFRRLKSIDTDACARVLALLQRKPGRHSFEEIVQHLPGLNPVRTFDDLRYVDGVVFLSNEPRGLTLLPELREELGSL